jgi:uncharacterized protein (TIGR04222 family)
MKNPITELTGPEFLVFYAVVIAATFAFCWLRRRRGDHTKSVPPATVPDRIDPYEIAYLRGGEIEVARVAVVRLTEMGYLVREEKRRLRQADQTPGNLSDLERCVYDWFGAGRKVNELSANAGLMQRLKAHTLQFEEDLQAGNFLTSDAARSSAWTTAAIGIAIVGLTGGSRLIVGLARGTS